VQFCKDIIDIKCVQRISRKYLFHRSRTEAVEADLQCARQTQLKALFLARLDAILRLDDADTMTLGDSVNASLTRIGVLPVLVRMGPNLAGFSPADSTPTVMPPAEPPPAEPPPTQVKMISVNTEPRYSNIHGESIRAHHSDTLASTEQVVTVDAVLPLLKSTKFTELPILNSNDLPILNSTDLPI